MLLLLLFSVDVHACVEQMARFYAVLFSFAWNNKVMIEYGETNFMCCLTPGDILFSKSEKMFKCFLSFSVTVILMQISENDNDNSTNHM